MVHQTKCMLVLFLYYCGIFGCIKNSFKKIEISPNFCGMVQAISLYFSLQPAFLLCYTFDEKPFYNTNVVYFAVYMIKAKPFGARMKRKGRSIVATANKGVSQGIPPWTLCAY